MAGNRMASPFLAGARAPARVLAAIAPGLALTAVVAGLAYGVRLLPGFSSLSPLVIAIVVGMSFHNLIGTPARARPGVTFALRRILRLGIVLLGLQLTLAEVRTVGATGFAIIVVCLVATFLATRAMGRLMGVEPRLAELIAAGTAICGASAVIATNTVTRGGDEDVAYAVACVTVFGSLSMLLFPALLPLTGFSAHAYGLWTGTAIHEVAQVVAAAFQGGAQAGEFGTVAKLTRVMLLAPLVLALGFAAARRGAAAGEGRTAPPVPWFVLGFMGLIMVNSLGLVPAEAKPPLAQVTTFLLAVALGAMGLETDVRKLRAKGLRPLLLGAAAWLFISLLSFGLIAGFQD